MTVVEEKKIWMKSCWSYITAQGKRGVSGVSSRSALQSLRVMMLSNTPYLSELNLAMGLLVN